MTRNAPDTEHGDHRQSFWRYYFHWSWNPLATPFVVLLAISLFLLRFEDTTRVMVEMRSWSLDLFWAISHFVHGPPTNSEQIFIVRITDSDYRNPDLFNSQSPLKPERVQALLAAVLALNPAVVGVDLDTKDATVWSSVLVGDCKIENGSLRKIYPKDSKTVVVWARMPVEGGSKQPESPERPIQLYQVLGGCAGRLNDFSGVPRFPLDADGVVRKYVDQFKVDSDLKEKSKVGSLAYVIAAKKQPGLRPDPGRKILNFGHKKCFPHVAAGDLLGKPGDKDDTEDDRCTISVEALKRKAPGNIVLIGGEFEDSRDAHDSTPAEVFLPQPLYGVELNAMAIDMDLNGGAITEVPRSVGFIFDLAVGTLFVWIFFVLLDSTSSRLNNFIQNLPNMWIFKIMKPRRGRFVAATIFTFLLAIGLSGVLYLFSLWMSFIPILLGANIHQYIAHAERVGEQEKEPAT
jgi:CHASE2 domain-containing sensor protein